MKTKTKHGIIAIILAVVMAVGAGSIYASLGSIATPIALVGASIALILCTGFAMMATIFAVTSFTEE